MKVLVTGATGFIGNRLIRKLQGKHEVFALARRPSPDDAGDATVRIEQDLSHPLDYSRLPRRMDAIIHLAQSKFYNQFPDKAEDIFKVNIGATFQLLDYAREAGVKRFIFTSTGGIYGSDYAKFVETAPVSPLAFYLTAKHAAELLITNYRPFMNTIIFRIFFAYGAGQAPTMLMPRLVSSVISGDPITLQGSEGMKLNPVYVGDVAEALARAVDLEGSHLIDIGGPQVLSLREIGHILGKQVGREPLFNVCDDQGARNLIGDVTKVQALLGLPRVQFSEGVVELCRELSKIG